MRSLGEWEDDWPGGGVHANDTQVKRYSGQNLTEPIISTFFLKLEFQMLSLFKKKMIYTPVCMELPCCKTLAIKTMLPLLQRL